MTSQQDSEDRELLELLRAQRVPPAPQGFYDQALVRAAREGRRRQHRRWLFTGAGAAAAAGLAVWVLSALLLTTPQPGDTGATIPGVTITLAEPRTINLVFASAEALDAATLTVSLPAGVELAGFPGQREIRWETSLEAGKNLLPLKLVALTPAGGELLARLEHEDRDRVFRLRVNIS